MQAQFLSGGSDFRPRGGGSSLAKNRRDEGLFWWTILITLLLGLATFCWFFSIMVFKYPEKPFNYKLLMKLQKLDPIAKFDPLVVGQVRLPNGSITARLPNGTFHSSRELLAKYYSYNPEQLRVANDVLKRSYIMNYEGESPVYAKGTFTVLQARPLTEKDIFAEGWVVRARSVDLEDVELELLLPGPPSDTIPLAEGSTFTLDNKSTFAAVVSVERGASDDGLCASVVPISYGEYIVGDEKTIALRPPTVLNMEATFPVSADAEGASMKVAAKTGF